MEEKTGWRGQNESQIDGEEKKNGRLVGAAETSKERAEWCRLQRKNLSILGLPKRKKWPRCHRESSWQERRSHLCQKKKEQSRLVKAPDREWGESQGGRERHLGERERGSEREHGEERVDSTLFLLVDLLAAVACALLLADELRFCKRSKLCIELSNQFHEFMQWV